jgi:hypothetical protein
MITEKNVPFWKFRDLKVAHLQQHCHNSKFVIFQEKLLKCLNCYNFLWLQRRHNCSQAASLANCVLTLYPRICKRSFIPVTQKCQILSCDTLVANEWSVATGVTASNSADKSPSPRMEDPITVVLKSLWSSSHAYSANLWFHNVLKMCGVYGLMNGRFIWWNHSYRRESLKLSLKILMGLLRNGWKIVRSQGSTSTYSQRVRSLTASWIEQLSLLYITQWSTISCLWRLHSLSATRNPPPFYGFQMRITVFTRNHR